MEDQKLTFKNGSEITLISADIAEDIVRGHRAKCISFYEDYNGLTKDKNIEITIYNSHHDENGTHGEETFQIPINYCPKCGKKL